MLAARVRVLAEIAARYRDLVEPGTHEGLRGTGEAVPHMPETYTRTVREFERLMVVMRKQAKQKAYHGWPLGTLRWHILSWFVDAERVIHHVPVTVVDRRGKLRSLRDNQGRVQTRPAIVYRRDPDAREDRALLGIQWIAENWGLQSEPMIPKVLMAADRPGAA